MSLVSLLPNAVGERLANSVALLVSPRGSLPFTPQLIPSLRSEYLEIDLLETVTSRCDAVIIAGGSRDPAHAPLYTDIPLIKAFQKLGIPTVIGESRNVDFSFASEYRRFRIPIIEQVDTLMGRVLLN